MASTRYLVEWTPWDVVKAAAIKRGMPDDGAAADYVDIDSFERSQVCLSFAAAVTFARKVLPNDTWASPRIRRQALVQNDHDDLGNRVEAMPSFETDATWEVFEDEPDPQEAAPDWRDAA